MNKIIFFIEKMERNRLKSPLSFLSYQKLDQYEQN
jgi:hypothetical protein